MGIQTRLFAHTPPLNDHALVSSQVTFVDVCMLAFFLFCIMYTHNLVASFQLQFDAVNFDKEKISRKNETSCKVIKNLHFLNLQIYLPCSLYSFYE